MFDKGCKIKKAAFLLTLFVAVNGCTGGGAAVKPDGDNELKTIKIKDKVIKVPPLVILAGKDKELGLDFYDDTTLLKHGEEALAEADFNFAVKFFARLLLEYPDSPLVPRARYSLGLALARAGDCEKAVWHLQKFIEKAKEGALLSKAMITKGACMSKLGAYEEAIALFDAAVEIAPDSSEAIDAYFYRGDALYELGHYEQAIEQYKKLINDYTLYPHAVVETITRIGKCHIALKDFQKAQSILWGAITYYKRMEEEEYIEPRFIAEAQYYLGEIYRIKFQNVRLEFPQEVMMERLEEKAAHLLKAQMHYLKTIRRGDVQWAAASGYRIGELYEEMYYSVTEAPVPKTLSEQEGQYYISLLKKRVRVLVKKAIHAYESTLNMAFRVGINGKWIELTNERMKRMKEIYINAPDVEEPEEVTPQEKKEEKKESEESGAV